MKEKTASDKIKNRKKLIRLAIVTAVFAVILVVLVILKQSARVSEFMVTKVSRNIILIMGKYSSALPFSLYELFLYAAGLAVIGGLVAIIVLLIRKKWVYSLRVLTSLVLAALVVANVYFLSAGFSYNRYAEYYPSYSPELTKQELVEITEYFIDDLNSIAESLTRDSSGAAVMPYSVAELSDKLSLEYTRLNGYDINRYTPRAKVIYSSGIMSEMHICGVFFAPFGEANVNGLMPVYDLPFTMAHELAHAKGVMREDEANEVALYITLTSSDPFIRYSGYARRIHTLLDALWTWEYYSEDELSEYNRLYEKISPLLRMDYAADSAFWSKYTKLQDITSAINDFYLKLMGQDEGEQAYSPPDTNIIENPVTDPDTGIIIVDPDTDKPIIEYTPEYNNVQKIFFRAYLELELMN